MAVGGIAGSLREIHELLAALTQTPELVLTEDECRALAGALHEVGRHYPLPVISPDKMALAVLVWTAGRIYVPRALAVASRKQGHAATAPHAPPGGPAPQAPPAQAARPSEWFDAAAAAAGLQTLQ